MLIYRTFTFNSKFTSCLQFLLVSFLVSATPECLLVYSHSYNLLSINIFVRPQNNNNKSLFYEANCFDMKADSDYYLSLIAYTVHHQSKDILVEDIMEVSNSLSINDSPEHLPTPDPSKMSKNPKSMIKCCRQIKSLIINLKSF